MQIFLCVILLFIPMMTNAEAGRVEKLILSEQNPVFRHVQVSGADGTYVVSGEAREPIGIFYYTVEDGHNEYIQEQRVRIQGGEKWERFTINVKVPPEAVPKNGTLLLNLYPKNEKGEITNLYPVILERRF
ncbi:intracellular proteinase inhibitor [Neobacillus niacini]|uniref:intracellular proteinase inhibitor n=1 Tax=Neobacillus niacini TaxID=86668 RepID=UPI0021CAE68A|nr:intracellular proteinase inhibitor [Neobacillus niacini]MCM3767552.1 intracellular proteinase inhibitor [Neobacillus niacini]